MVSSPANTVLSAFTEDQVERVTGVSRRQLRYWASDFYPPGIAVEHCGRPTLRLYSFRDLVCLKVLDALRNDAKIPLQELRRTKTRLAHLGDDMWATTTLYVLGKKVVVDNPETGTREEAATGQGVLQIPLRVVTARMEDAVLAMRSRDQNTIGKIEQKRSVAQNQPVISGTRIPVRSIQAFAEAGYSAEDIAKQYPTLTTSDIDAAVRHERVA